MLVMLMTTRFDDDDDGDGDGIFSWLFLLLSI
jgi:hypothetical protein